MAFVDPNAVRYSPIGAVFPTGDTPLRRSIARGGERIGQVLGAFLKRRQEQEAKAEAEAKQKARAEEARVGAEARAASMSAERRDKIMKARMTKYKALLGDEEWVMDNPRTAEALQKLVRAGNMGAPAETWIKASTAWQEGARTGAFDATSDQGRVTAPVTAPVTDPKVLEQQAKAAAVRQRAADARLAGPTSGAEEVPKNWTNSLFLNPGEQAAPPLSWEDIADPALLAAPVSPLAAATAIPGKIRRFADLVFGSGNMEPSSRIIRDPETGNLRTWTPQEQEMSADFSRIWEQIQAENADTLARPPTPQETTSGFVRGAGPMPQGAGFPEIDAILAEAIAAEANRAR